MLTEDCAGSSSPRHAPARDRELLVACVRSLSGAQAWMTGRTTTDAARCFNMSLVSALLLDTAGPMYKYASLVVVTRARCMPSLSALNAMPQSSP